MQLMNATLCTGPSFPSLGEASPPVLHAASQRRLPPSISASFLAPACVLSSAPHFPAIHGASSAGRACSLVGGLGWEAGRRPGCALKARTLLQPPSVLGNRCMCCCFSDLLCVSRPHTCFEGRPACRALRNHTNVHLHRTFSSSCTSLEYSSASGWGRAFSTPCGQRVSKAFPELLGEWAQGAQCAPACAAGAATYPPHSGRPGATQTLLSSGS